MNPTTAATLLTGAESGVAAPEMRTICACCGAPGMELFHSINGVPTNSCILLPTREEALAYPRGDVRLAFCRRCGFISNIAFDPKLTEYSGRYEETQAFSPTFNIFQDKLAHALVERHDLHNKELIEIGCGKGEFLRLMCNLGSNRGLGFDPGYSEARGDSQGTPGFRVIRDFFSEKYTDQSADFVACKMTLEHIPTPELFLSAAVRTVREDGVIFIQVPESLRILRDCAFEDIYYEHCSYFSAGSLGRLFHQLGLRVLSTEIEYDGQYLTVEATFPGARVASTDEPQFEDLDELARHVAGFPMRVQTKMQEWQQHLARWESQGKRVAIWGSGSKGVSFLTGVPGAEAITHAVDINPYRHGYFMPKTGQQIVGPQQLREIRPDAVIVMNRIYVPEIKAQIGELGLTPELLAL
jgi:SAM-dependent methyltransferase